MGLLEGSPVSFATMRHSREGLYELKKLQYVNSEVLSVPVLSSY
jgi:hypothetical protein